MDSQKQFSVWLREELKSRHMSQLDLAELAELSPTTINNILAGRRDAEISTYYKIASALDIPVDLVLENAGLLPSRSDLSAVQRRLRHLAVSKKLEESDLELAILILEQRIKHYRNKTKIKGRYPQRRHNG